MPHRVRDKVAGTRVSSLKPGTCTPRPAVARRANLQPGLWVDGRPLAAQIGYYSLLQPSPSTRAHAEPEKNLLAHLYRAWPAAGADGGDSAFGRGRGTGVGAVFQ